MLEKFEVYITPFKLKRMIHVYLPVNYDKENKRYPVLYMYDGHNLFLDEDATYGASWRMAEYLNYIEGDLIVVGIECNHEGNERLNEFCPYEIHHQHFGDIHGRGEALMDWVVEEFKPMIDQKYRTRPEREYTGIGGSSMGGLMSIYTVARYNAYFSKAACLSSAISFCFNQTLETVEQSVIDPNTRVYLDWGSNESRNKKALAYATSRNLEVAHLFDLQGASVYPRIVVDGAHNEQTWEKQVPIFLHYLFDL